MSYDYGMGQTNIDKETDIRFGVIPQNDVLQAWADSSEPDYGAPTCPKCGNEAVDIGHETVPDLDDAEACAGWEDEGRDYACPQCRYAFYSDEAYGDEPLAYILDDGEYQAQSDDYGDIFIVKSPYYTLAPFCSPCAPGACYLRDGGEGEKAYCFGPDWFDGEACPYPVYRVDTGECVYQPNKA